MLLGIYADIFIYVIASFYKITIRMWVLGLTCDMSLDVLTFFRSASLKMLDALLFNNSFIEISFAPIQFT